MLTWASQVFFIFGLLALTAYAALSAYAYLYQSYLNRSFQLSAPSKESPTIAVRTPMPKPRRTVPHGATLGRLEISRLGLSVMVLEGIENRTLRVGAGHIRGTALPGDVGNIGIAAHRDTFFRKLEHIQPGDRIQLTTPDGVYQYAVHSTRVVDPEDVEVLDPREHPTLTLVTCFPFQYIGSAPKRFIVHAHQVSD